MREQRKFVSRTGHTKNRYNNREVRASHFAEVDHECSPQNQSFQEAYSLMDLKDVDVVTTTLVTLLMAR